MSMAYWCVLAAAIIPYFAVALAKALGSYDNRDPRAPGTYKGTAYRAFGAHQNGLESFPFFAAAVFVASFGSPHAANGLLNSLALAWIGLRLVHLAAYLIDRPTLRSVAWIAGFFLAISIFTMPAWHG